MEKPLVSIVIPFYNSESTIIDAVKSVFAQTYKNWELILLNDGSSDGGLELVSKIKDKRVKIISDGVNRGLIYRLNQSSSLIEGEYLVRMDADDLMHPLRISKQIELFLLNKNIDLVDTGTYSINEIGEPVGIRGIKPISHNPKLIIGKAMLLHASVIGKKEWFVKNQYNPDFIRAEDCELWLRTYKNSIFKRVQEPLYIVREGKINVSNYIQGVKTIRKILKIYGLSIFSKNRLRGEIIKTYLKIMIYSFFGFFKIQNYLSRRRNIQLTEEEKKKVVNIINEIKKTVLPM